jgi:predicted dehydrogenase
MNQLTQKLKDGRMQITEVPVPDLRPGMILVRNFYSLISAGTESSTVKAARKGYIGKAKERPQQVKQVIDTLMSQGPVQTYRAVMKKLDAYSPLGYSCVGEVIDIGSQRSDVRGQMSGNEISHPDFKVGDIVACGGATASHAEIVAIPEQLCVKINLGIQGFRDSGIEKARDPKLQNLGAQELLKAVAYNTLGAIALQGVRQADLKLGETCAVIGLGLLGQLTAVLLKASGVRVIGIDIDPAMVELGREHCLDLGIERNDPGIESKILEFSGGIGCDGVIITAASNSNDPINFAGTISRKKGTVVVVGAVPTGFDRDPHFYRKELTIKMSCSYGPGRYDSEYEEKGRDYPVGYVRWTEKRNMQAFQELIAEGKIDIGYLTTHVFKLEDAPKAYDMIVEKSEPFVGILIEYDRDKEITKESIQVRPPTSDLRSPTSVSIGFIGAGSYAQSYLLPNIPKGKDVVLKGVMTSTSTSSRSVADRFGFEFCTGNEKDILENDEINTIFIATRHDSHGYYVKKALEAGKNVFVEKPLCLTEKELEEIILAADPHRLTQTFPPDDSSGGKGASLPRNRENSVQINSNENTIQQINESRITSTGVPLLMVGYNRRFSPLTQIIKEKIASGPMSMIYRINAGTIPADSWIQDMEIGGGRILGEVCHFIDYLTFINGSLPVFVFAAALDDANNHNDTLTVSLKYQNGSVGSVQYFANGSKSLPKEYVEVYSHGVTAILNDFRELKIYGKGRPYKKRLMSQDKGQKNEVKSFINSILKGATPIIPLNEIINTTDVTFKIIESIKTGKVVKA